MPYGADPGIDAMRDRQTGEHKTKNDHVKVEGNKYFKAHISNGGYVVFDARPYFDQHPDIKVLYLCCTISEVECPDDKSGGGTVVIGG